MKNDVIELKNYQSEREEVSFSEGTSKGLRIKAQRELEFEPTPKNAKVDEDLDFFCLGFLWGIGRFSGERFIVQYKDQSVMNWIRDRISPFQKVFPIYQSGKKTYRLQLHPYNPYTFWLHHNGYEGRKGNEERTIPTFAAWEEEAAFLRGYFLPHHSFDQRKTKQGFQARLRFYAAKPILERLNYHLHQNLQTTLKKILPHSANKVCYILNYQSKQEVPSILEYLELNARDEKCVNRER